MTDAEKVREYMNALDHPFKAEIQEVIDIILQTSKKIAERVKRNAPSFFYKENPKYDMLAFHIREQKHIHLVRVFPKGLIEDDSGLLEGQYKDRRMMYFYSGEDIQSKKPALENIVRKRVEQIECAIRLPLE